MTARVLEGDCLLVMPTLEAESVDAIVCDPPYGLKFMGKAWDHGVPGEPFWREALRVAKPGAHLVAFGGPRTWHRLAVAIEDAGWEIRDNIFWIFGSGFPKSHDVSKAIDKAAGAERPVVGVRKGAGMSRQVGSAGTFRDDAWEPSGPDLPATAPATDAAKQWEGWGTALKPAAEPIILARKPLKGTVASNVTRYGTGGLNIDGCRIPSEPFTFSRGATALGRMNDDNWQPKPQSGENHPAGRWPANLVLDESAARMLDEQSGERTSGKMLPTKLSAGRAVYGKDAAAGYTTLETYGDSGGASRFFYTAKSSRAERSAGLAEAGLKAVHPTVKPLDLMQWLCRLVTPKGGLILDPFTGSGSTGRAAVAEGFDFIGIELSPEYAAIARARIAEYAPLFTQDGAA